MKKYIEILNLPKIQFAHVFSSDEYTNVLDAKLKDYIIVEVAYIAAGSLECVTADGRSYTAPTHSVVCNFHEENIEVCTHSHHEHRTVGFAMKASFTDEFNPKGLCLPLVTELPIGNRKIPSLIDEIIMSHTVQIKGEMTCTGLFLQLLDAISRHNLQTGDVSAYTNYKYVKKAKEYIFEHLNEAIVQTDIAAHLGISSEYLCNVFKTAEGMPIMQFINRVKLEQIRSLMKNHGLTLAEASDMYGYSDPNYVSRLHKKYFQYNITNFKKDF